ncbi:TPA: DUF3368 domain-containing protein [Legionella pneumophila]|uniref:hypothetical protein n=1 Tax=Legionella pneumophila TaxID=446 RepID=UPI00048A6907|nr:hypothetical protein [Legionella pneumophila]HAT1867577.1 PIN domain-containing protein [Legionella pneumophila]HAT1907707.1 PIN domain-containing protein [Legionella pneumophila]HAT1916557.1 PIN domain-containing protein [Legionella pneumophila]HAT1984525.1 PIN domain-containing protein [Legionella pneumophila]HAT2048045.1 PIN domain-containing protein [Legionella pneumophila]
MMLLLISDSCVLIDIEQGELTSSMFSLPYQFVVPDTLFEEELAERHADLKNFGLISKSMRGELIAKAYNLRQQYNRPSLNDLLALILAVDETAILLTGDRALRAVAKVHQVEVHGTIWLVEQMIINQLISTDVAKIAFLKMKHSGSRLPWSEVARLLKNYGHDF